MLVCISDVLSKEAVAHCRKVMGAAAWEDGRSTAGEQSAAVKHNMQLPEGSKAAVELGNVVLDGLSRSQLFLSAALPLRIFPPLFNSYGVGQNFGVHVDNAIRAVRGTAVKMRTDLSATLFLSEPDEYDGGELTIETLYGAQEVKLPAGDMVLYPSTSLHRVSAVTRGRRIGSFFWIQSMIRAESSRSLLFELDQSIQELAQERGIDDATVVRLTGVYHNLIREWAET